MKRVPRIVAAAVGLGLAVTGLTNYTSTPTAQAWSSHDAVIKYVSGAQSKLMVCHSMYSSTQCSSGVAWLPKGQNTRSYFGWADADGFWLDSGVSAGGYRGPRWVKVAGCGGCTFPVYLNK